ALLAMAVPPTYAQSGPYGNPGAGMPTLPVMPVPYYPQGGLPPVYCPPPPYPVPSRPPAPATPQQPGAQPQQPGAAAQQPSTPGTHPPAQGLAPPPQGPSMNQEAGEAGAGETVAFATPNMIGDIIAPPVQRCIVIPPRSPAVGTGTGGGFGG